MTVDGYNTRLFYGDEGDEAATELLRVQELTPPALEVGETETSHLTTPDKTKTFKGGWKDPGSVSGTMEYDADQYDALLAMAGTMKSWKVQLADTATTEFDGFVKTVGQPIEREGLVTVEFTIRVSGKPTFTKPTGS